MSRNLSAVNKYLIQRQHFSISIHQRLGRGNIFRPNTKLTVHSCIEYLQLGTSVKTPLLLPVLYLIYSPLHLFQEPVLPDQCGAKNIFDAQLREKIFYRRAKIFSGQLQVPHRDVFNFPPTALLFSRTKTEAGRENLLVMQLKGETPPQTSSDLPSSGEIFNF